MREMCPVNSHAPAKEISLNMNCVQFLRELGDRLGYIPSLQQAERAWLEYQAKH
jgi:hypothetical protein